MRIIFLNVSVDLSVFGEKLKGKGKVRVCTGTEALYKPYAP